MVNCICDHPLDVVVLLDGGVSSTANGFLQQRQFVSFLQSRMLLSDTGPKIGVIQYSNIPVVEVALTGALGSGPSVKPITTVGQGWAGVGRGSASPAPSPKPPRLARRTASRTHNSGLHHTAPLVLQSLPCPAWYCPVMHWPCTHPSWL